MHRLAETHGMIQSGLCRDSLKYMLQCCTVINHTFTTRCKQCRAYGHKYVCWLFHRNVFRIMSYIYVIFLVIRQCSDIRKGKLLLQV